MNETKRSDKQGSVIHSDKNDSDSVEPYIPYKAYSNYATFHSMTLDKDNNILN